MAFNIEVTGSTMVALVVAGIIRAGYTMFATQNFDTGGQNSFDVIPWLLSLLLLFKWSRAVMHAGCQTEKLAASERTVWGLETLLKQLNIERMQERKQLAAAARRNALLLTAEIATTKEECDMDKSISLMKIVAAEKATEEAQSKLKISRATTVSAWRDVVSARKVAACAKQTVADQTIIIASTERQLRASKLELSSVSAELAMAEAELRRKRDPSFSAAATFELMQHGRSWELAQENATSIRLTTLRTANTAVNRPFLKMAA
ncbi:unnamed protein product [Ectocarpus fasciculatus]